MRRTAIALVAVVALIGAREAAAQDTAPMTASIVIPQVISIDVSSPTVAFPAPTAEDYEAPGYVASGAATTISTRANVLHRVTISTADAFMAGGDGDKPSSHLQWSTSLAGAYAGVTTAGADVVTGLARGVHATAAEVFYRMVLDVTTDAPATYDLDFVFTAIAQ